MPMPEPNTAWPPPAFLAAYLAYAENNAWWTGDQEELQKLYGGSHELTTHNVRNGVLQDIVRKIKDRGKGLFWGPRNVPAKPGSRQLLRSHLPAAANLATLSSDLQFAQSPTFLVPGEEPDSASERVKLMNETMNTDRVLAGLGSYGEMKAALGAAICIPMWDEEVAPGEVWFESFGPDTAVPEFQSGRLKAVTLWSEVQEGNVYWRLLSHHGVESGAGYVEHALFEGKRDNLGKRVDLAAHDLGAPYLDLVDSSSRVATGLSRLDAVYGINSPTIEWRKDPYLRYAGRSDFAQLHGLFDDLDQAWSSWMRDLRLGRGRLFIPDTYLENLGRGQGAAFDELAEYVTRVNMPGDLSDSGNMPIKGQQFEIRVEQHERTLNATYREILRKAGFSPSAWGDGGGQDGGQITATEIDDRNAASERTRKKKNMHDRQTLGELARIMLEVQAAKYKRPGMDPDVLPVVEFPDATTESPKDVAETVTLLNAASAISLLQKVARANPGWTSKQVQDEVDQILEERGQAAPDPAALGLVLGAAQDADDEGEEDDLD
ncbi:phage portal protein [Leucobacter sp. USCH14]|uniref:phage portal protein n=1 Tax=Leucobacter sp. USCH14 TaxID=3024838 RepID=UPI0030B4DC47